MVSILGRENEAGVVVIIGDGFIIPISQCHSFIYIVLRLHLVQVSVMYKKVLSRPIGLWSEKRKKRKWKTFGEDNISFPKRSQNAP
jgi:hypothetical protein